MEIAIAIAGLIIAWLTYKKTFYPKLKEEKEHLMVQFRATQTISNQVRENLEKLAEQNNWYDQELFPNITYRQYLDQMKSSYENSLSEQTFEKIQNGNFTKSIILSMTRSLEQQFEALQLMKTQTEIKLKQ